MATTIATQVQQLYVGLLGRAADQGGQNWWVEQITTGGRTLDDIRASFVTSAEYTALYGGANTTRTQLVTAIYQNLFERTPSAGELEFWATTDTRPANELVSAFLEYASANDQKTIGNKVFVAQSYTDAVGTTNFTKAGAAAAIADVDGTVASVNTAIAAIANGTLNGQVPAVGLINALAAAQAAEAAGQTGNTAAVDALVTKLAANVATGTDTDNIISTSTYADKVAAITADAKLFRDNVSVDSTAVLTTRSTEATAALETARTALSADAKTKAATYESAVTANAALKATATTQVAAVKAGLAADTAFTATVVTTLQGLSGFATIDDTSVTTAADTLYSLYVNATAAQRLTADNALKDVPYFTATYKAAVTADIAKAAATTAESTAKDAIDLADGQTGAAEFSALLTAKKTAADNLTKAQAADVDVAAVKVITDANKVLADATTKAGDALTAFNSANTTAKAVDLSSTNADATVKESFYFAAKPVGANDFTIGTATTSTQFAAGDSIVLGSAYSYNSGALSTGDNNKLEFFLVKVDAGVQVVVETTVAGSTNTTFTAAAGVTTTAGATDTTAVITLAGVTLDHVSVNNGVISYV